MVADVSELGVRFIAEGLGPPVGAVVVARLTLPETSPIEIEGTVVRRDARYVALSLVRGVPFGVILDQQRLLSRRLLV